MLQILKTRFTLHGPGGGWISGIDGLFTQNPSKPLTSDSLWKIQIETAVSPPGEAWNVMSAGGLKERPRYVWARPGTKGPLNGLDICSEGGRRYPVFNYVSTPPRGLDLLLLEPGQNGTALSMRGTLADYQSQREDRHGDRINTLEGKADHYKYAILT